MSEWTEVKRDEDEIENQTIGSRKQWEKPCKAHT